MAGGNFVMAAPARCAWTAWTCSTPARCGKCTRRRSAKRLDAGELVLLSPLGYSPTGEIFNLTLEDVAAEAAIALAADKLIFLIEQRRHRGRRAVICVRELTVSQAERGAARASAICRRRAPVAALPRGNPRLPRACPARASDRPAIMDGALLLELFTRDGVGTMVSQDPLERLRAARIDDVGGDPAR